MLFAPLVVLEMSKKTLFSRSFGQRIQGVVQFLRNVPILAGFLEDAFSDFPPRVRIAYCQLPGLGTP